MGNGALQANGFTNTVTVNNHITVRQIFYVRYIDCESPFPASIARLNNNKT
jgi:hypothetical protein